MTAIPMANDMANDVASTRSTPSPTDSETTLRPWSIHSRTSTASSETLFDPPSPESPEGCSPEFHEASNWIDTLMGPELHKVHMERDHKKEMMEGILEVKWRWEWRERRARREQEDRDWEQQYQQQNQVQQQWRQERLAQQREVEKQRKKEKEENEKKKKVEEKRTLTNANDTRQETRDSRAGGGRDGGDEDRFGRRLSQMLKPGKEKRRP